MGDPSVVMVFRSGWRQPLDRATVLEIWDQTGLRSTVPADLLLHLLMHHLRGLTLTEHLRRAVTTPPPEWREDPPPPVMLETTTSLPRLRHQHGRKLRGR